MKVRKFMRQTTFGLFILILLSPAMACTQLPAVVAFIAINDQNNDRALNSNEWLNARGDINLAIDFKLNNLADFEHLDHDGNGKIEARELGFERVRYVQNPCERYQVRSQFKLQHTMGFVY